MVIPLLFSLQLYHPFEMRRGYFINSVMMASMLTPSASAV